MEKGNEILVDAYRDGDSSWDSNMKTPLETNGMINFYLDNFGGVYLFVYKKHF